MKFTSSHLPTPERFIWTTRPAGRSPKLIWSLLYSRDDCGIHVCVGVRAKLHEGSLIFSKGNWKRTRSSVYVDLSGVVPFLSSCCKSAADDGEKQFACVKEGFPSVACVIKNHGVSFPLKQIWVIPSAPESPRKGDMFAHLKEKQVRRRKIDE